MKSTQNVAARPSDKETSALAFAKKVGAIHLSQVNLYISTIFKIAPQIGLDPAVLVAQSAHETGNWSSEAWESRLNPAGIGITDGADLGLRYSNGRDAALAQMVHMWVYSTQSELPKGLSESRALDGRYQAVIDAGWQGTVRTINDLTGKWATDPDYSKEIAAKGSLIFQESSKSASARAGDIITFGRVPHHTFQDRLITNKPAEEGWSDLGTRKPRGVVLHRMLGTLWGTDGWFRRDDVLALTDYGVGNSNDGSSNGSILRWNDPRGIRSGWASGPVNTPYGDGLKFVNRYGINAVNRDLVSIEISGDYETPWSNQSFEAVAQLVAYWADQCEVPWHQFPLVKESANGIEYLDRSFIIWHQELTIGSGKICPGGIVMAATNRLIERVQAILKSYQVKESYRVNLKLIWPEQSSGLVGKLWESESRKRKSYGRPDSRLWGKSDGQGGKLYLFTDGLLIRKYNKDGKELAEVA